MSPGTSPQRKAPASPDEVFAAWDKDNSRSHTITEFRAGMDQLKQSSMVARLGGLFRSADANHNSRLEAGEYATLPLIKRAGKDAPPLSTFDINKDGALDNQEYLRMVEALIRTAETQGG
jgi:Ca2+-binding EF-hand superfamily protein